MFDACYTVLIKKITLEFYVNYYGVILACRITGLNVFPRRNFYRTSNEFFEEKKFYIQIELSYLGFIEPFLGLSSSLLSSTKGTITLASISFSKTKCNGMI